MGISTKGDLYTYIHPCHSQYLDLLFQFNCLRLNTPLPEPISEQLYVRYWFNTWTFWIAIRSVNVYKEEEIVSPFLYTAHHYHL